MPIAKFGIIKAFIFDMDGVITDTMPYHFKAWQKTFANAGIAVNFEDIYKREGQKGIDSVREISKEKNILIAESQAHRMLKEKEILFKKIFKRRFIVGSRSMVRRAKARGFKLALVTGTSRHEAERLLPAALWQSFDITVCGCDVQNGKPHPEPYQRALKHLKIKPQQALVIENAPFGIRSAKTAGCYCVAIATSLPKNYLKHADLVINDFKQIHHWFKS